MSRQSQINSLLQNDLAALKTFKPPTSPNPSNTSIATAPSFVKYATKCDDGGRTGRSPTPTRQNTSRCPSPTARGQSPCRLQSPIAPVPKAFANNVRSPSPNAASTPKNSLSRNGSRVDCRSPSRRPSELDIMRRELEESHALNEALLKRAEDDGILINSLSQEREDIQNDLTNQKRLYATLERDYQMKVTECEKEKRSVEALRLREAALKSEIEMLQKKIIAIQEESRLAQETAERRIAAITEAANHRMCEYDACVASLQGTIQELHGKIHDQKEEMMQMQKEKEREILAMDQILRDGEIERMRLHGMMADLKGNVRVCCRVRPLIPHDREYRNTVQGKAHLRSLAAQRAATTVPGIDYIQFPDRADHRKITVSIPTTDGVCNGEPQMKDYQFQFDKVFEPSDSQDRVFEEIQQLVQSALDGYKVCIFAYGQTGSGKTYTMEGPSLAAMERDPGLQGMIPRAVEQIFTYGQKMKAKGWAYSLTVSFVEIYNEQIRDLLNSSEAYQDGPQTFQDGKCRHEIRNVDGYTILTGVTEVPVDDAKTVHTLLNISARNRKSSMTAMNDRASRSHSVFSLKIVGNHEGSQQQVLGVLNLVDLAGSERLALSGAEGERLKETAHINKSLSCLGDVIVALAKGDSHVPFRNSKLTHMLQPYMGNESKTLMFVNVSPSELFLNETLNSLRFAAKVNACEIGLAKKKISSKK